MSWPLSSFRCLFFLTTSSVSSLQFLLSVALFLHSSSPSQFRFSFLGICSLCQFFISHSYHMTSPSTPQQFLLNSILHSILHSYAIHSYLISSTIFRKPGHSSQVQFKSVSHHPIDFLPSVCDRFCIFLILLYICLYKLHVYIYVLLCEIMQLVWSCKIPREMLCH